MPDEPYYHYNDSNKEHKQRDAVHAMHEFDAHIARRTGFSFPDIEIRQNLLPHIFCCFATKVSNKFG
jgi:hypothetical protein